MFSAKLWHDLAVSSQAFIWGFSLAVVVGIPVGLVMGWRRRVEYSLDPFLTALYASPLVALAPLFIIVFGVGVTGKAALVFLLSVFPFVFNTFAGVKSTDALLINVIRSFGGGEADLYLKVILPSTIPYIIAGARLAIGRGLVGIIVGEFYAASEGIGFAISQAGDTYRLPEMFVGIIILSLIAVALTELMRKLELTVAPWRAGEEVR
jgi:ABC-type nitrate/sulfonate/bicarbonate transport system permease component